MAKVVTMPAVFGVVNVMLSCKMGTPWAWGLLELCFVRACFEVHLCGGELFSLLGCVGVFLFMNLGREDWEGDRMRERYLQFGHMCLLFFFFLGFRKSDAMWKAHSSEGWCAAVCAWG